MTINSFASLLKYKGVVFDLDGTLVNSMPLHIKAWQRVAQDLHITLSDKWLYEHGGVPSYKIAKMLLTMFDIANQDPEKIAQNKTAYYLEYIDQVEVFPKMLELLKFLKAHNIAMSIGTGTLRSNAEYIVKRTVLHDFIKVIVSADEVVNHKPNPDTFLLAAKKMQLPVSECIVFEDTNIGVEAAKRGGFSHVLVKDGVPEL